MALLPLVIDNLGRVELGTGYINEDFHNNVIVSDDDSFYYQANLPQRHRLPNQSTVGAGQVDSLTNNESQGQSSTYNFVNILTSFPDTVAVNGPGTEFDSGTTVNFDIGGPTPATGASANSSSQLLAESGMISIDNAVFHGTISGNYVPQPGDVITLIDNQAGMPVMGAFAGLPEGAITQVGGYDFAISYAGGTSADVTLTPLFGDRLAIGQQPAATVQVPGQSIGSVSALC